MNNIRTGSTGLQCECQVDNIVPDTDSVEGLCMKDSDEFYVLAMTHSGNVHCFGRCPEHHPDRLWPGARVISVEEATVIWIHNS